MDLCAFGRSYWKYTSFYDSNCEISFYLHLAFLLQGFQVDSDSVAVSANQRNARKFEVWIHSIWIHSFYYRANTSLIVPVIKCFHIVGLGSNFEPSYKEKYTNKFKIWTSLCSNQGSTDKNESENVIRTMILASPAVAADCPDFELKTKYPKCHLRLAVHGRVRRSLVQNWRNNFHLGRIFLIIIKGNEDNASSLLSSHSIGLDWCPRLHIF